MLEYVSLVFENIDLTHKNELLYIIGRKKYRIRMNIINAESLTKSYTGRSLLENADFSVQDGEKVGIVGINGTGKSTLLKILAGIVEPDDGKVTLANHLVLSYLPQTPEFTPGMSVLEAVRELAYKNSDNLMVDSFSASFDAEVKTILNKLGITDFTQRINHMSGGQRKRAALAAVLLSPSDVLLLDEPTNHLDIEMVEWLENRLRSYRGSVIMITHDRYFLDSVCNRIVEVTHGKLYSYDTDYQGYLELQAERMASLESSEHTRQNILRKEIAWMQRGARARSTKQKAHIQRYEALRDQEAPVIDKKLEMESIGSLSTRMGKTTIEISHLSKRFDENVILNDFSYNFQRNDRVGFLGPNGCGKTTLMKLLTGRMMPDSGEIKIGQTIKIGYYAQEISTEMPGRNTGDTSTSNFSEKLSTVSISSDSLEYMDPNIRVIDYIRNTAEYVHTAEGQVSASAMLDRFLFPPNEQYSLIGKLSGGEKRRLNLLRVLMEEPNVLILDEPTNDLDTETLAILEDFLDAFDGIVITVSHDRYFLDRIVSRLFVFEGEGKLTAYEGGYSDYRRKVGADGLFQSETQRLAGNSGSVSDNSGSQAPAEAQSSKKTWKSEHKKKFSYMEQKEWDTIEDDIAVLEERLPEIDAEMAKNGSNFAKLSELQKEKDETEAKLEEKMERWEYLSELWEEIQNQ